MSTENYYLGLNTNNMEKNSNKITKEILVRLSQDDESAFDVIYWSYNTPFI